MTTIFSQPVNNLKLKFVLKKKHESTHQIAPTNTYCSAQLGGGENEVGSREKVCIQKGVFGKWECR